MPQRTAQRLTVVKHCIEIGQRECPARVPPHLTDQGMAAVEIRARAQTGHGIRRAGDELAAGSVLARAGAVRHAGPGGRLAATGIGHVVVRPSPRVVVIATGDELVDAGRASQPGQVVDVNSHALTAAAAEAGALAYRVGICDDDPEALRGLLEDQTLRADLIITTGGTGTGPGDMVRRILSAGSRWSFTDVSLYPCSSLGFGTVGGEEVPVVCLPGDPGAALIGFEVLARPVIQMLAGAEPVFRPSVRAHLLETVESPVGLREFRPAQVAERRGGGYTVAAAGRWPVHAVRAGRGERADGAGRAGRHRAAGSTVDVLLLDRRR